MTLIQRLPVEAGLDAERALLAGGVDLHPHLPPRAASDAADGVDAGADLLRPHRAVLSGHDVALDAREGLVRVMEGGHGRRL